MKVNNSGNAVQGSEVNGSGAARKSASLKESGSASAAEAAKRVASDGTDANTEISAKGKDFAKAKAVASAAPDVREEKIAELKKRIAAGKYHVDADAVADRMMDEHIKMSEIG